LEKNCPIFRKVAKTDAKPNNATIQNMFLNSLLWWKCTKIVAQGIAILGYFFNESTKSSLIGEKSPNLVTLVPCLTKRRIIYTIQICSI
jgi:hypothetical protein